MPTSYDVITQQIIRQLEAGVIPWRKPWTSRFPMNLKSQKPYRGINVFSLAMMGYASPYWLTFKQANDLGGHIRKGEHGTAVTFWKVGQYDKNEAGKIESKI